MGRIDTCPGIPVEELLWSGGYRRPLALLVEVRMDLSLGIALLQELPEKAAAIPEERALAKYLSNFARYFATGIENEEPEELYPPGFWLFLPFSTAADFPGVSHEEVRQLAVASTCMIIYNILFDATVDNPGRPDLHTQVLAE